MRNSLLLVCMFVFSLAASSQGETFYREKYRPQFHFTPAIHWTNDPNGLVYHKGEYHLFYQFNPMGNRWGHMTWGHAVSRDLVHWQHLPIAIPEEKDTMIFSGSCVVDSNNTAGFATKPGEVAMVAIYTAHVDNKSQTQHIAYSLDDGRTWTKYKGNPVLDLNKKDFRDPKVFWYAPHKKWVMAVAWPHEKQIQFYSSNDLKGWNLLSTFGPAGDTTGIWECPDLLQVPIEGTNDQYKWMLLHSPAPYMQYWVGEFDGKTFRNENPAAKIMRPDYGPDYYAAITFNNLPEGHRPVSIGWANNWNYANDIPTSPWRSAMSLPRELSVKKYGDTWVLLQKPPKAFEKLRDRQSTWRRLLVKDSSSFPFKSQTFEVALQMAVNNDATGGVRVAVGGGRFVEIGYDNKHGKFYVDRTHSGDFTHKSFAALSRFDVALPGRKDTIDVRIFADKSLLEVYINGGEAVMTFQLFPGKDQQGVQLFSRNGNTYFAKLQYWEMESAW